MNIVTANTTSDGDNGEDDDYFVNIEITGSSNNDSGNNSKKHHKKHYFKTRQQRQHPPKNAVAAATKLHHDHHHHLRRRRRHNMMWMICGITIALIMAFHSISTASSPFYDYYYSSTMISNEESSIQPSSSSYHQHQQVQSQDQVVQSQDQTQVVVEKGRYRIFHCGYKFGIFKDVLFPPYELSTTSIDSSSSNNNNTTKTTITSKFVHVGIYYGPKHNTTYYESDILYYGIHGDCPTSYETLVNYFRGKILLLNGEPYGVKATSFPKNIQKKLKTNYKIIQIGMRPTKGNPNGVLFPGLNHKGRQTFKKSKMIDTYYGPMALLGYIPPEQYKPLLLNYTSRPKNYYVLNNHHQYNHQYNQNNHDHDESSSNSISNSHNQMIPGNRVVYMASRCYDHRQNAAKLINDIVTVDALGYCQLSVTTTTNTNSTTTTTTSTSTSSTTQLQPEPLPALPPPLSVSNSTTKTSTTTIITTRSRKKHYSNWQIYRQYKYCLVLENSNPSTYISEKLFYAFVAGCVPIYWGNRKDISKLINPKSYIWWNTRGDINRTLNQIQYLESNYTAYLEMLNEPIFGASSGYNNETQWEEILRKYFSYSDDIGDGYIKKLIHKSLGIV